MLRAKGWIGVAVLLLALCGLAQPAGAVALWSSSVVGTGTGGSVTVGGLTITATSCTAKVGGTNLTSAMGGCSILNLQLVVVSGTNPEIEIEGTVGTGNTSGAIFSTANTVKRNDTQATIAESAGLDDLTVVLTITSSTVKVNNIGASLTGSVSGTPTTATLNDVNLAESYASASPAETGSLSSGLGLGSLPSHVYSGTVSASAALASPTASFTVTKDIQLNPVSGYTMVLSNVTQTYKTPEPVSIAVFMVGLGGLAAARRRRRR